MADTKREEIVIKQNSYKYVSSIQTQVDMKKVIENKQEGQNLLAIWSQLVGRNHEAQQDVPNQEHDPGANPMRNAQSC